MKALSDDRAGAPEWHDIDRTHRLSTDAEQRA